MTSHWDFISAAYGFAFIVIGGVIITIMADYRGLKNALRRMALRNVGTSGSEE